jgi:hypothetical protein
MCQFHSFSRGFLTTDCADNTDENTALIFSYPRYPCYPWSIRILAAAPLRCDSAGNKLVELQDGSAHSVDISLAPLTGGPNLLNKNREETSRGDAEGAEKTRGHENREIVSDNISNAFARDYEKKWLFPSPSYS